MQQSEEEIERKMDLVKKENYFIPRRPEDLSKLPLETMKCIINKYEVEKYMVINLR